MPSIMYIMCLNIIHTYMWSMWHKGFTKKRAKPLIWEVFSSSRLHIIYFITWKCVNTVLIHHNLYAYSTLEHMQIRSRSPDPPLMAVALTLCLSCVRGRYFLYGASFRLLLPFGFQSRASLEMMLLLRSGNRYLREPKIFFKSKMLLRRKKKLPSFSPDR